MTLIRVEYREFISEEFLGKFTLSPFSLSQGQPGYLMFSRLLARDYFYEMLSHFEMHYYSYINVFMYEM